MDSSAPSSEVRGRCSTSFGGRYQSVRILKQSACVETHLATEDHGQSVVVKTASRSCLSVGAQMRLEHEADALRQVDSPYIAPLLELGRHDDLIYIVMPLIEGKTLEERLSSGPLSVTDTLSVAHCLLTALKEAHDQGVLHRDLKPANIIINSDAVELKATLIDFGLSRSVRLDASIRDEPVGTARYISPEQAGLLEQDPDERSDLYSAGVVLFECLAGRPPFMGKSVGEVLRQHLTEPAPELRSLGVAVPRALEEVIQRLLRKDPRDRYQTADAVLPDVSLIANALKSGVADPPLVVGLRDRRRTLTEPAFVGREFELAALDDQVERVRRGEGGLTLLEAESGGGKTRLLVEIAQRNARRGCRIFRGQGLDQAAQRPFQLLFGVAAELIAAAKEGTELRALVRERLGEQRDAVCAAIPELAETLGAPHDLVVGPESFGQARTLQALCVLLDALGSADAPALVLLDDCQWADALTFELLSVWQRRRNERSTSQHVMVVVAFRAEEVPADHLLRSIAASLRLSLPPFNAQDVRRLAESMAGPLPREALEVVEALSEGSPFMAAAVLQGLVESGALVAEPTGWRVESLALADVQSSRHAAAFLVRRIQSQPKHVVDLLSAGAVLGKEFELDFAAWLAEQTPTEAIAAIDEARRRHMIWSRRNEAHCAFIHDKLRQTLLEGLGPGRREQLHRRAAQYLSEKDPTRVFELAYHFDAAGLHEKALPFAMAAAEKARSQHSLEIAEQQYQIARRGVSADDQPRRFLIAERLGEVSMLRGRYGDATREFEAALDLASGARAQAEIEGKLGELAFKRGDVKSATTRIEHALSLLGRSVPRNSLSLGVRVGWEVAVQFCHSAFPKLFLGRKSLDRFEDERLSMHLYSRLAHLYWFHRGTVASLWAHLQELNRAEAYPPTAELAQAYSEHAPGMSLIAWFSRGIEYAQKSLVMRKEFGDLWGQGQSLHFYGIVLYAASQYRECVAKCREAVRLLERTGDYWEVNIARFQTAASLYRLGDLAGAVAEAQRMHRSGVDLGDAQAAGIALDIWARAALGKIPEEIIRTELDRSTGDVQRNAQVLLAEGVRLYYAGDAEGSVETLTRAHAIISKAGIVNAWVAPVLPWLTSALRFLAEQTPARAPGRRNSLLRQAKSACTAAIKLTRKFKNDYSHALREYGLIMALLGQPRVAKNYLDKSLRVADRLDSAFDRAQTLQVRGELGRELGWRTADADVAAAQQAFRQMQSADNKRGDSAASTEDRPVTLSLVDRFETVLELGRRIASALSREAVFAAVREAAMKLVRGEHCVVMQVEGEPELGEMTLVSGEMQLEYSRGIVRQAIQARGAITVTEGMTHQTSESILLSGIRSALCAPIFVRGAPIGCFYVTHRKVAGLFGENEERLANFIATLAGAALENAEGFAELRRLNETLHYQFMESQRAKERITEQAVLLDKARDAIWVQDLDGRILYWNQSSERLYGWTSAEVLGQKTDESVDQVPCRALDTAKRLVFEKGDWTGELTQRTKDGKTITVESRWTLVRDDAGNPKSKLVVNTDATEKKRLEAQFFRAQRLESVGTLAGGIAHDINNVLLPIMMSIEILKEDIPKRQRVTILDELEASARRGADMVKQILSFARGIDGEKSTVNLQKVVREMTIMIHRAFPKTIEFKTAIAEDLWSINGDATQLYQAVMNLCVNARDAMPKGGTLSLAARNVILSEEDAARTHPDARPGKFVEIAVSDTGTGIPPDILEKIFDPFFTTKEFGKGTGLGLSTVLGIAKGHEGFLQVRSVVGLGTEFSIFVPAVEVPATPILRQETPTMQDGHGETILVVDDEPSVCSMMQKSLESHGYKTLVAPDGLAAMNVFETHKGLIRVVLTDLMMPGMDGVSLIKALKRTNPKLRTIGTSGVSRAAGQSAQEFDAFLDKPFKVDSLLKTVSRLVSK
jgi:PAS domain S-box-containing protein